MGKERSIRVILAKLGLDGHDVGIRAVANEMRNAGMDVIFLGIRQTPESVVNAAVEEDVDVIGLSFHSLVHRVMTKDIVRLLKKKNVDDVLLIVGGSILDKDAENLKSEGVSEVFGINSDLKEIVKYIKKNVTY